MPIVKCSVTGCNYTTPDMGDAIVAALLQGHITEHGAAPSAPAKAEKVKRPSLKAAGTTEDWEYFLTRWTDYAEATKVTGRDKIMQLLECCEESLRKDLTRSAGGSLCNKPEEEVLTLVRHLAVREENVMVARTTLHDMKQDGDETIRSFGARIKGQANVCKFATPCPSCGTKVNYTEEVMRDVLARGIADPDIQLDLLGDSKQDMTLEEMFRFIENKEAGKRSASRLSGSRPTEVANTSSSYKKQARTQADRPTRSPTDKPETCNYCNKPGHGRNAPAAARKTECPAFGSRCDHCGKANHFASVCKSRNKPRAEQAPITKETTAIAEETAATFSSMCLTTYTGTISDSGTERSLRIDHHVYDEVSNSWIKRKSRPQPTLHVTAQASREDYVALGFDLNPAGKHSAVIPALADTGCQSCLAGPTMLRRLGLRSSDLIPVTMQMHTVTNLGIKIIGAAVLRISAHGRGTRQLVYITDQNDKLLLSREACTDLGIIPASFPQVSPDSLHPGQDASMMSASSTACNCPRRQAPPPPPTRLPFPGTQENLPRLKRFLLDHYQSSAFNTCEHQPLPLMDSPPMTLMIDPNAKPVAHHTPIPVPIHWRDSVKAGLDQDVRLGVIEPVPVGEPVTWCHQMVICPKKNGEPRRTVDLQPLNAHATRETHHTPSPFHQARSVPRGKKKTVLDAWNGYHSVPIREEDRHLTTFITPWGRYRYRTAPQGYIASGDGYTRRYDELVAEIPNKTKCVDDVLLWSDSIEDSFFQAVDWLDLCGKHGIILNPSKFALAEDTVEFAGFEITPDSVRPSRKYLQAILDFPTPTSITDIRSWFGLVNQVSYAFSMTNRMLPFRQLLQPSTPFHWTPELQQLFEESKRVIVRDIERGVRIFDPSKPTCLATDWSKDGIGFWLLQKHCNCRTSSPFCCHDGWQVTLVGSRFTHAAESRYAPIEGEALAVADALDKARYFVLGCRDLTVAVDHKPLIKLFGDRSLEAIPNNRLRNLKEKTLRYRFRMTHVPGVRNKATDCLSRHPTGLAEKLILPDDIAHVRNADDLRSVTWDRVRTATTSDADLQTLMQLIDDGFPDNKRDLPRPLQEYFQFRQDLHTTVCY